MIVVVKKGSKKDNAHHRHLKEKNPTDRFLGEGNSRSDFDIEECPGDNTTISPSPSPSASAGASPGGGKGNLPDTGGPDGSALLLSIGPTLLVVAGTLIIARKRLIG